jgi:diguanylate cyclase (GGDEF)-like protein
MPPSGAPLRVGLQAKILALGLVCVLLPLLVVGAYLLDQNERVLGDKAREGLAGAVTRRSDQIDDWLHQRLQAAHSWSLSFVVYEGVEAVLGGTPRAERARKELDEYLATVLQHHPDFESLTLTDLQGRPLASTRVDGPEPAEWSFEIAPDRSAILTPPRRSSRLGRPTMLVVQGISGRNGRVIAVLFARIDVRALEPLLRGDTEGPEFWLADGDGRLVAERGRIVDDAGARPFPIAFAEAPATGAAEAALPGAGRVLYAASTLRGPLQGHVVATSAAAVAYRPLADARRRLIVGGSLVLLVIVALNLVASRGLSQSLQRLAEGARRMSAGDLDVALPVSGRDEVAELTASFNEMARRVRESHGDLARANEELRSANRVLETLSITDGLTGLYNHRHFYETLAREVERSSRESAPLSLLLLDLDHFKQYNDRYGHTEGDAALRLFARQLLAAIRSSDIAFRYGGEELAVLLPACPAEQAMEVGEKVRAAVEAAGRRSGNHPVTTSVGVATCPDHGQASDELVALADIALYDAKRAGRNRVVLAKTGEPASKGNVVGVIDPSRARASRR